MALGKAQCHLAGCSILFDYATITDNTRGEIRHQSQSDNLGQIFVHSKQDSRKTPVGKGREAI